MCMQLSYWHERNLIHKTPVAKNARSASEIGRVDKHMLLACRLHFYACKTLIQRQVEFIILTKVIKINVRQI
jgi:hypothetical protein